MKYQKTDLPGDPVYDPEKDRYGYEIIVDGNPPDEYILWFDKPVPFGKDHRLYDPELGLYTYDMTFTHLPPVKVTMPEPPELRGPRFLLALAKVAREAERKKALEEKRRSEDTNWRVLSRIDNV